MTGLTWFTITQAAKACDRSPKTIANLISKYQLPRRIGRQARWPRRRVVYLSPETVETLQRITMFGEKWEG